MKQYVLTIIAITLTWTYSFSQDVITTKSGKNIQAKVIEVGLTEIKYKMVNNLDGPIYSILKSDVIMTRYENGIVELYKEDQKPGTPEQASPSNDSMLKQGMADAAKYYKSYTGAGTGTLLTSLVSPLAGLIPAIACSSTMPKDKNLHYPNTVLMNNPDYYLGFTQKAKKIKQGRVWLNWGIGFGVNVVAEFFLLMAH